MAHVAEMQTRFAGMFFLLRRVVRKTAQGFEYTPASGGAMVSKKVAQSPRPL